MWGENQEIKALCLRETFLKKITIIKIEATILSPGSPGRQSGCHSLMGPRDQSCLCHLFSACACHFDEQEVCSSSSIMCTSQPLEREKEKQIKTPLLPRGFMLTSVAWLCLTQGEPQELPSHLSATGRTQCYLQDRQACRVRRSGPLLQAGTRPSCKFHSDSLPGVP